MLQTTKQSGCIGQRVIAVGLTPKRKFYLTLK